MVLPNAQMRTLRNKNHHQEVWGAGAHMETFFPPEEKED